MTSLFKMKWMVFGCLVLAGTLVMRPASAEWYVAGQFGANFADQLSDIRGSSPLPAGPHPAARLDPAGRCDELGYRLHLSKSLGPYS